MPRNPREKDYEGPLEKLYNIRLYTDRDKEIRNTLVTISKNSGISLEKLILDYIERGLGIIDMDSDIKKEDLDKGFDLFFENYEKKKITKLKKVLKDEKYKRRERVKIYISNKFPNKTRRHIFYLRLIKTQIYSEIKLFSILFSLSNPFNSDPIDYYTFYCNFNNLEKTENSPESIYNDLKSKLLNEWFYELKTNGIINELRELKDAEFNFKSLEMYISNLYKKVKVYSSLKEENEEPSNKKNQQKNKNIKKKKIHETFPFYFNDFFRNMAKVFFGINKYNKINGYGSFALDIDLFDKIKLKPYIIFKNNVLNLNEYFNYISSSFKLGTAFKHAIYFKDDFYRLKVNFNVLFLYLRIFTSHQPSSYLYSLNNILSNFPNNLNKDRYDYEELLRFRAYLQKLGFILKGVLKEENEEKVQELKELSLSIKKDYLNNIKLIDKYLEMHLDSIMNKKID